MLAFVAGSVKEPSSFIFYLPPHPHFPPPTYTFVLQNPFISWFSFPQPIFVEAFYMLILLKKSEVVDVHFQYCL